MLKEHPELRDAQEYVAQLEVERGFAHQNVIHKCLLLGEEIGELFKAIRKLEKLNIDQQSQVGAVSEELADILIYVCAIANRCNVDLEQAFRAKEQVNSARTWHQPSL